MSKNGNDGNGNDLKYIDMENRAIFIFDEINSQMSKEIALGISILSDSVLPITIQINSPGGVFDDTCSIISSIKNVQNETIVDISGVAYSGAAMIALAGKHRKMSKFGNFMLHYGHWIQDGTQLDHEITTKHYREHFDRVIKELLLTTKMNFEEFKKKTVHDFYVSPKEALKYGFVNLVY